jgi:hypothetical protein
MIRQITKFFIPSSKSSFLPVKTLFFHQQRNINKSRNEQIIEETIQNLKDINVYHKRRNIDLIEAYLSLLKIQDYLSKKEDRNFTLVNDLINEIEWNASAIIKLPEYVNQMEKFDYLEALIRKSKEEFAQTSNDLYVKDELRALSSKEDEKIDDLDVALKSLKRFKL